MTEKSCKWDAADYASNSASQFGWAMELIEKLRLQGDDHVLDIGCGDGKVSAEIARRLPKGAVIGVDGSQEMIELAFETFSRTHDELGVTLRLADFLCVQNGNRSGRLGYGARQVGYGDTHHRPAKYHFYSIRFQSAAGLY